MEIETWDGPHHTLTSCDEARRFSSVREGTLSGKIDSGQLYTVLPVVIEDMKVGDIVLCKVNLREHGAKRYSELSPSYT
jgi:hypothetical protein